MKIMAIDYGDAHTGIAISDATGTLAGFTTVINAYRPDRVTEQIALLAKEHGVERLVLGHPINMDGTRGPRSEKAQAMRQLGIRLKLNPLRSVIEGKRLVVIDDSIVRGNTSKKLVQMLRDAGAAEVHLRIVSPEVLWPCFYGIDTDTREQLIAANMTLEEMNDWIGSDSLAFISLDGLRASLADAGHDGFCTACFTGDYPVPIPDDVAKKSFLTRKDFEAVYAGEVS